MRKLLALLLIVMIVTAISAVPASAAAGEISFLVGTSFKTVFTGGSSGGINDTFDIRFQNVSTSQTNYIQCLGYDGKVIPYYNRTIPANGKLLNFYIGMDTHKVQMKLSGYPSIVGTAWVKQH